MIGEYHVHAVIPARGNSKGIIKKNLRQVNGKSLVAIAVESAKRSTYIDQAIVTSDHRDILLEAEKAGADVTISRPAHLAQDDTPGVEPIIHAIDFLKLTGYVVLVQPTSPLRCHSDIDKCIEQCFERKASTCASVCKVSKHPYWMFSLDEKGVLHRYISDKEIPHRRQELPRLYQINGAVYVAEISWLLKNKIIISQDTLGVEMPVRRSVDIDSIEDLKYAEVLAGDALEN